MNILKTSLIVLLILIAGVTAVSASISVNNITITPIGDLVSGQNPPNPVTASFVINFNSVGGETFPSGDTLAMSTDLDNGQWSYITTIDGNTNPAITANGRNLNINGWVLSYPSMRELSMRVTLIGEVPLVTAPGNKTIIRVAELNNNSEVISGSEVILGRYVVQTSDSNLNLGEDWNLVSVPKKLAPGNDTGSIFKDVDTDGRTIWEYDGVLHNWTPINANTPILPLYGLWIYSKSPTTVQLKFDPNPLQIPPTRHLIQGWNLIGFSGTIPASARDTLISVRNTWTQTMGFDTTTHHYEVQIINGGDGLFSDSRPMNPTKGYWLFMTGPGDLSAIGV